MMMSQGLFTAVSGIRANQTKMDVISNNVANLNTTAFKSSSANFETVFDITLSGGSAPTGTTGGTNPAQVGVGTQLSSIGQNWNQGATQSTGVNTNLMFNGDGFFIVEPRGTLSYDLSNDYYLTRAGNFQLDANGYLATSNGYKIFGTSSMEDPVPSTKGFIQIPQQMKISFYTDNTSGQILGVNIGNTSTPNATLTSFPTLTGGTATPPNTLVQPQFSVGTDGGITMSYGNNQFVIRDNPTNGRREIIFIDKSNPNRIFAGVNQQASDAGMVRQMTGYEIFPNPTGGNGMEGMSLQIMTASVTNPQGLIGEGGTAYSIGPNSGAAQFGIAARNGRGTISSGRLESSNVDLSTEFSSLVITQRGLEASSKMVTTYSSILETIVNMVR
ncbi:MAG: flagellar hook-basal body complex protein [Vampirovibrionales bacterium]